jgi:hypothetical protein
MTTSLEPSQGITFGGGSAASRSARRSITPTPYATPKTLHRPKVRRRRAGLGPRYPMSNNRIGRVARQAYVITKTSDPVPIWQRYYSATAGAPRTVAVATLVSLGVTMTVHSMILTRSVALRSPRHQRRQLGRYRLARATPRRRLDPAMEQGSGLRPSVETTGYSYKSNSRLCSSSAKRSVMPAM